MGDQMTYKFRQRKSAKKIVLSTIMLGILAMGIFGFYLIEDDFSQIKPSYIPEIYLPIGIYKAKNLINPSEEQISKGNAVSIPVLLYQGVVTRKDGENTPVSEFRSQMFALKENGYKTITLEDFYAFERGEKDLPVV